MAASQTDGLLEQLDPLRVQKNTEAEQEATMPVIVTSSPKGGVGKTTTSLILATEYAHQGHKVVLIDTDANKSVVRWSGLPHSVPENITVVSDVDETSIAKTIRKHDKDGTIVIVDLEGIASLLNSRAMAKADLVLITTKAASIDADMASRAVRMIEQEEDVLDRKIPHCVVFTQTAAGVVTTESQHIIRVVRDSGLDVVTPFLTLRTHYSKLHAFGGGLRGLPAHPTLDKAISEAESFSGAVYKRLEASLMMLTPEKIPAE